jgi:hypothetical protein
MKQNMQIAYCGVCCNHCGMQSHIPKMAKELQRFIEAYRYDDWIAYITQDFDYQNFSKGLDWFAKSGCRGCTEGGGMPSCEVRKCCTEKKLQNCYFCQDFSMCKRLAYQKQTYKIEENFQRISQIGYEKWLKEQHKKANQGFDNIHFLEKKV